MLQYEQPVLDSYTVAQIAASSLNEPVIDLGQWQIEPISYPNMNPEHRGLYRVHGDGFIRAIRKTWSVILKISHNPDELSIDDPRASFYWKREALIFQSHLLDTLPAEFRAPRCFGVTQRSETSFWLWLEDVQEPVGTVWTHEHFQSVAHDLGLFSGAFVAPERLPEAPWLSQNLIHAWVADFSGLILQIKQVDVDGHLLLRATLSHQIIESTLRLWDEREKWFTALNQLPPTLCHQDVWRKNLFSIENAPGARHTVAIDWEVAGVGAIGEDLGNLIGVSVLNFDIDTDDIPQFALSLVRHYVEGLREAGWHGNIRTVSMAASIASAMRCLFPAVGWPVAIANDAFGRHLPETEQRWGRPIETVFTRWAALANFLLDQMSDLSNK